MKAIKLLAVFALLPSLAFAQTFPVNNLLVNGALRAFVVRTIGGTTTIDSASSGDTLLNWNSSATANKTQNIPSCGASNSQQLYIVKDGFGNANTYPITITPGAGTIEGGTSFVGNTNRVSWSLICDGANTNWIVE